MRNRCGILAILVGFLVLAVIFAGCSDTEQSGDEVTTVPTTELAAKFATGDIIAKTSSSTESFMLIVRYDATTDKYERALAYKNADGSYYRKDAKTDLLSRSTTEKLYPVKITHISSLSQVPIVTPTVATTATTAIVTTTTTTSYPAPTVSSITPNTGAAGTVVSITSIAGTNFRSGATVKLENGTTTLTISGSGVDVRSASNITCYFSIPSTAMAGLWNLTVTNYDGKNGTLAGAFTITNTTTPTGTAPTVTSITPSSGIQGNTVSITNLTGTGFQSGAAVVLSRSGSANITAVSVMANPTQITCSITIPSYATTGSWNVLVINPDGLTGTLSGGFTISYPAPTVSGITPANSGNATSVSITNLAGTNFRDGATVKLIRTGYTDVVATDVAIVSPTQITCSFDLEGVELGLWNVQVTNSDSQSSTYSGFTVS
ncbi:MAG: hypothetical protein A4E35_00485 [Methanoregula sp. PtaU1.Bin051]|nr:MAG: hypothetical protein A4E35_00485 [Methanoregula sp. PtaU1.Bin051]